MSRGLEQDAGRVVSDAASGASSGDSSRHGPADPPTFTLEAVFEAELRGSGEGGPGVGVGPAPGKTPVDPELARETSPDDETRRARLRAATAFLATILGLLVLSRAFKTGGLLAFQAVIVAALGAAFALLAGEIPLTRRRLRRLEIAVFALASMYLSARQYEGVLIWLNEGDEALLIAAVKNTLIATILLIVAYCMLIPNTWTSALRVVLVLAAVPAATELTIYLTHPGAFEVVLLYASPPRVAEDLVLLFVACGLSVYGIHVINTLRAEALVARQLNQYRLVRRLGCGGMGEVYLGEHRLLKRPCAVKLIRPDTAADPIELARFEREVRATARLSHPNTVEVFDYGRTDDGMFYYVMEYLRGLSLEELVQRHGPMPPGRVIFLLRQVCGALEEAHAAGLVHRDVKPANIFAAFRGGRFDLAKLLDFGLVKGPATGASGEPVDVVRSGMIRGTPLYMSPRADQRRPGPRPSGRCLCTGGVAYKLLTGQPPFDLDSRREVLVAHLSTPALLPRELRSDLPSDLEAVVLRCLEKHPEDRYPDASSVAIALAACRSATEWDEEVAASWWFAHEPESLDWGPTIRRTPGAPANHARNSLDSSI
ncbi:MAG: serine/threonine-protein kinase [Isosphaeraceae bacterium]